MVRFTISSTYLSFPDWNKCLCLLWEQTWAVAFSHAVLKCCPSCRQRPFPAVRSDLQSPGGWASGLWGDGKYWLWEVGLMLTLRVLIYFKWKKAFMREMCDFKCGQFAHVSGNRITPSTSWFVVLFIAVVHWQGPFSLRIRPLSRIQPHESLFAEMPGKC